MKINKLILGSIGVNCYLVSSDNSAIVIDPGFYSEKIVDFLKENQNKERIILLTHGHFDHIGAAKQIADETGVKIGIGKKDENATKDSDLNLSKGFGFFVKPFEPNFVYEDQDEFNVGDTLVKVFETPGHTAGSVCYLMDDNLFSGDMLFLESYGRTDFPGGSFEDIKNSFYRLTTMLNGEIKVYPGHGESTTISHEIDNNPLGFVSAI